MDDNELDLGLGLSCGGFSSKSTVKENTPLNIQTDDFDQPRKTVEGFRGFPHGGEHIENMNTEFSRPPENFFDMLSSSGNKSTEVEENLFDASNKRKSIFSDLNHQKKHEHVNSLYDKGKTSHISISTTDEGSTAENEDVVDSAVKGSMSRYPADQDPGKQSVGGARASSNFQKEAHASSNSGAGKMGFNILPENGPRTWTNMYNVHHGNHSPNMKGVPVSSSLKESGGVTMPGSSDPSLQNVIQIGPNISWDQSVTPGNISMGFGHAPVQSQQLGKDHMWGILPRPQQLYPPYAVRPTGGVVINSENQNNSLKLPQGIPHPSVEYFIQQYYDLQGSVPVHHFNTLESSMQDGKLIQPVKGTGKQHISEEIPYINITSSPPTPTGGISTIRPGIAADIKFDGTGSYPDLPWVSTKGSGPNGKTISGVTYRFSPNQIKIVCACHGTHMLPEEFVKHANEENKNPEDASPDLPSLPSNNPAATTQN